MSTHLVERSETEFDEQSETVLAEQSSQPAEQVSVERETRTRTQTEKGREYRVTFLENNFKTALSVWRRASNKASVLMSDCQDSDILRAHKGSLEAALDEFHIKFYQLQGLKEDVSVESEKSEQADIEHHRIMQSICECIREIESQKYEVRSNVSSKSAHSKSSRTSSKSDISKISDAAARKAAYKAELKYIDIESKFNAELKKIRTIKKIEIAGAEQAALEEVLDYSESKYPISLPKCDKMDYVKDYVKTHAKTSVEADTLVSDSNQLTSVAESQSVFIPMHQANQDVATSLAPFAVSSTDVPRTSCITQSIDTSIVSVLNPFVQSFVPSFSQPASVQSSWIYNNVLPATSVSVMPPPTSGERIQSAVESSSASGTSSLGSIAVQSSASSSGTNVVPSNTVTSSPSKTEQGLIELAKTLADQVNLSRLPSPEPSIFSGDPLNYPGWKSAFQILIEQRKIPPSERIHYLKRYVTGPVRDTIEGYFILPSDKAYEEAKKTLDKRYGDPFVISNAFRDKLEKWPKILPRDGTGLRKFSDFLQQCQIAMQTISSLSVLDDDRENRKLLTKLPDWIVSRWGRVVSRWKEDKSQFPPFKEFVEFMTKEATIACDPVTSLQSLKEISDNQKSNRTTNRQEKRSYGSRTFLAEVEERDKKSPEHTKFKVSCTLCNKSHELDDCRAFLAKPLEERKIFAREKQLCFACLQGGHISRRCKHRMKCKICSKFHPSSLHGDKKTSLNQSERSDNKLQKSEDETAVKATLSGHAGAVSLNSMDRCRKCSMIVPVYVSHCDSPERERLVYALLDTQSDTTFILEDTQKVLGVSGTDVKLSLSTMYAANKVVTSVKVKGLMVRGINDGPRISLPNAYTRSIMPANQDHIPTSDMARMWPHLEVIANQIEPLRDCEIGLLIGYNCPRALAPREVIASIEDGPYGLKTDLGWSIVGIVDTDVCEEDPIGLSHRILSQEVVSPSIIDEETKPFITFSVKTKVKEVVSGDVLRLMEQDFSDFSVSDKKYSQEDKKFVSALSQGIHFENGHYEMPLPSRVLRIQIFQTTGLTR